MAINTKDTEYLKLFGQNLRQIRLSKKFTVERLAMAANISYSQISRIESSQINPTICTVAVIAKALKIHPTEIFNFEYEGTYQNMIKNNLKNI